MSETNNTMSSMLDSLEILAESPDDGKIVLAFGDLPEKLDDWLEGAEDTLEEVDETLGDLTELLEDVQEAVEDAQDAKTDAEAYASNAEAWAVGKRGGVDVDSDDDAYHNNSKYYQGLAASSATTAGESAVAAAGSASDASDSATAAAGSASDAEDCADAAAVSETNAAAAQTAAETAQGKAEDAQSAAEAAQSAAETAQGKAEDAQDAAEDAQDAAEDAQEAAEAAQTAAETAQGLAETAQTAAETAKTAAETAQGKAETAQGKAEDAQTASETAQGKAEDAQSAAETAQGKAEDAQTAAEAAQTAAETAQGKAEDAQEAAETAQDAAEDAQTAAEAAQSAAEDVKDYLDLHYTDLADDVTDLKTAKAPCIFPTASGAIASFADGADGLPLKSLLVSIDPVQSGSGDPAPDNVRPITGHTQAVVTRTGKNLLDMTQSVQTSFSESGGVWSNTQTDTRTSVQINVRSMVGTNVLSTLVSSVNIQTTGKVSIPISGYESNAEYLQVVHNGISRNLVLFKVPWAFTENVVLSFDVTGYDPTTVGGIKISNIQIEVGSTASVYQAYTAQSVTVQLGQTVYGGTLDAVKGKLTIDRAMAIVDENANYNVTTGGLPYASISISSAPGDYLRRNEMISNKYTTITVGSFTDKAIRITGSTSNPSGGSLFVYDSSFTDETTMKQILAVSPVQVCYPLYTPQTYTLILIEIQTLLGYNAVWSDAGAVEVEYPADTKTYIDSRINLTRKLIAGIETGFVASKAYSVGDMLIIGDDLYKVASSIASGATITVGTNVTKTTVAEQLLALANA